MAEFRTFIEVIYVMNMNTCITAFLDLNKMRINEQSGLLSMFIEEMVLSVVSEIFGHEKRVGETSIFNIW